jgi:hypothetical protein
VKDDPMARPRPHSKTKRGSEAKADQQRPAPLPTLMTYDPYLIKLTRSLEDAKEDPKTRKRQ